MKSTVKQKNTVTQRKDTITQRIVPWHRIIELDKNRRIKTTMEVCSMHRHFLISVRNITEFSPAAPHNSVLLVTSCHLMPITLRKHRLTTVWNLFVIWIVTFHVLHSYSSADLTLLWNIRISLIKIFLRDNRKLKKINAKYTNTKFVDALWKWTKHKI
jgi:hypothetical protein